MHIAVVAPPFYEVPPTGYGGIELVCHSLVEGLLALGHDVTLIAAGANRTKAQFIATFAETQREGTAEDISIEVEHAARAAAAIRDLHVDVVHDHTRAGALTAVGRDVPTVLTWHAPLSGPEARPGEAEAISRHVSLVAVSAAQREGLPELPWAGIVHNGILVEEYPFDATKDEYVLYLGRFNHNKGVHLAVEAAMEAGRPLVIAGSWTTPVEKQYFDERLQPLLGSAVTWVGEVGGQQKTALLARAACLVFPSTWNEPFGLSIIEALACGTPVVGLRRGALPELIDHRRTGIVCDHPADLASAIDACGAIDPAACRQIAESRFSATAMARGYQAVYQHVSASRATVGAEGRA